MSRARNSLLVLLLTASAFGGDVTMHEERLHGRKAVVIENDYYRAVLVPELARFPLSMTLKPDGPELFAQPTPLDTPNRGYQSYGGIIDALPWVSGKVSADLRLPEKGCLYTVPWSWSLTNERERARFEGAARITYPDPVTGQTTTLGYGKTVTAYARALELRMDHVIQNAGRTTAHFTFSNHARTAIAQRDKGDYFHAPGRDCFVYYMKHPDLAQRGITPPCWAPWPLPELTEFNPCAEESYAFAYVPGSWCAVGDDKRRVALFFTAGKIVCAGREDVMKMAVFMTNAAYLVEPCVTYSIRAQAAEWAAPESTLLLEPGEECRFTVSLVPHPDVSRAAVTNAAAAFAECVLLERPRVTREHGVVRLRGRIIAAGEGRLEVREGRRTIRTTRVAPGVVDLAVVEPLGPTARPRVLVLILPSRERTLLTF